MAMVVYTAHEPQNPSSDIAERAGGVVFVREGFTWGGFLLTALWLLLNRLWFEALAAVAFGAAAGAALIALGFGAESSVFVNLFVALVLGFEGNDLRRWRLERKGYALIAAVAGRDFEDCQRRFFDSWLPYAAQRSADGLASWPGAAGMRNTLPSAAAPAVIGTFHG